MVKLGTVCLLFMLISSCLPPSIHNRKFLLRNKKSSISDGIRKDGYYFYEDIGENNLGVNVIIFFEGGFLKDIGFISAIDSGYHGIEYKDLCPEMSNAREFTAALRKTECVLDNYRLFFNQDLNFINKNSVISDWGKYEVDGDSIKIQYFYNYRGNYYLTEKSGIISADNTITLSKKYYYRIKKNYPIDVKYRFQNYDRKDIAIPDVIKSIN